MSQTEISNQVLKDFIKKSANLKILVIGDVMLDRYIWGKVSRISPEAPIPIIDVNSENSFAGGAANVARNIIKFAKKVNIISAIGNDLRGKELLELLKQNHIGTDGIIIDKQRITSTKTRIISGSHHIVRVDREKIAQTSPKITKKLIDNFTKILPECDAVIIQDYGKGIVTQTFVDAIAKSIATIKPNTILTIDPNPKNPITWRMATAIKPNLQEAEIAANFLHDNNLQNTSKIENLQKMANVLLQKWQSEIILITLGAEGICLIERDKASQKPKVISAKAKEVYDVSGAGDTCIAFFTMALAIGFDAEKSAKLANHSASIVVGKIGTATIEKEELLYCKQ